MPAEVFKSVAIRSQGKREQDYDALQCLEREEEGDNAVKLGL